MDKLHFSHISFIDKNENDASLDSIIMPNFVRSVFAGLGISFDIIRIAIGKHNPALVGAIAGSEWPFEGVVGMFDALEIILFIFVLRRSGCFIPLGPKIL